VLLIECFDICDVLEEMIAISMLFNSFEFRKYTYMSIICSFGI